MQTLRDRQIREVLDEDLNINRRVNDLTQQKVRLSEETVAPKKTRDLEIEVSVDKLIENLNKILETKITALDYLLSRITRGEGEIGDAEGRRAYNLIVNNGDFITSYNQLIRLYTQPNLARASSDMIRTKFQELKANIDAILYGLSEGIQYLFDVNRPSKDIFQMVRSQAVYDFVNQALYRGSSYKIIEQGDIAVSIQNVLAELSEVQRKALQALKDREDPRETSLLNLPIETGADEARIKALEAEIGFRLPEDLKGKLGRTGYKTIESEYGRLQGDIVATDKKELDDFISKRREERASLEEKNKKLIREMNEIASQISAINAHMAKRPKRELLEEKDEELLLVVVNEVMAGTFNPQRFRRDIGPLISDKAQYEPLTRAFVDFEETLMKVKPQPVRQARLKAFIDALRRAPPIIKEVEAIDIEDGEQQDKERLIKMLEAKQNLQDETIARIRDIDERIDMLKRQYEASLAKMGVQTDVPPKGFAEFLSEKKIKPKDLAKFSGKPLTAEEIRSRLANKSAREQIDYLQSIPSQYGFKKAFNKSTVQDFISGDKNAKYFIDALLKAYKEQKPQAPQAEQREAKVAEEGRPQGFEEEIKEEGLFNPEPAQEFEEPEEEEEEEEGPVGLAGLEGFGRRRRRTIRLPKDSPFHFSDGRNDVYRMKGKGFMTDIARKFANIFS
jgi:hypothetical protein